MSVRNPVRSQTKCAVASGLLVGLLLVSFCLLPAARASGNPDFIGDEIGIALEQRAKQTGEKFIVTPKAISKEKSDSTRNLLAKKFRSTVIRGWTILHLPEEDISVIKRRMEQSLAVWEPVMATRKFRTEVLAPNLQGADFAATNVAFSQFCGVFLQATFRRDISLFVVDRTGTLESVLCRDYMLILAVNDITVSRRKDGLLVAEMHTGETNGPSITK